MRGHILIPIAIHGCQVEEEVLSYEASILKIWDLVCEFDVLLSFAISANALDFRKPTIVKDKVINGLFDCKTCAPGRT